MAFLLQIFLPCFFGHEVIAESEKLSTYIYSSNWVALIGSPTNGREFSKILIFLMERLKYKREIVIAKLFPLSLTTFTSVLLVFLII